MNYIKSNKKYVQFFRGTSGTSGFPTIGQDNVFYYNVNDNKMYYWDDTNASYVLVVFDSNLVTSNLSGDATIGLVGGSGIGAILGDNIQLKVNDGSIDTVHLKNEAVTTEKIKGGVVGQFLKTGANGVEWASLSAFMVFRGSVPDITGLGNISNPEIGDVYNVINDGDHENINYVYVGTGGDTLGGAWDSLGGTFDVNLDDYVEKETTHTISADTGTPLDIDHDNGTNFGIKGGDNITTSVDGQDIKVSLDKDITVDSVTIDGNGDGINLGGTTITDSGDAINDKDVPNWGQVKGLNKTEDWGIDLMDNEELIIYPVNDIEIGSPTIISGTATVDVYINGSTTPTTYPATVNAGEKLEFKATGYSVWKMTVTEV